MDEKDSPATKVRIAVRPLGSRDGQVVLLAPAEISYAFLGSATPPELRAIYFNSDRPPEMRRVYVRTSRGVGRTKYRRLAEFNRALGPAAARYYFPINRTCVINGHKIWALYPCESTRMVEFLAPNGQKETLEVSRRDWPALRDWLGLSPKRAGATGASANSE